MQKLLSSENITCLQNSGDFCIYVIMSKILLVQLNTGGGIMVWCCMATGGVGQLEFIESTMDK